MTYSEADVKKAVERTRELLLRSMEDPLFWLGLTVMAPDDFYKTVSDYAKRMEQPSAAVKP